MHSCPFFKISSTFLFILLISYSHAYAQEIPEFDEISVFLDVPRVGGGEIAAVIRENELYLPVTELFDFLKIKNTTSSGLESITGFFINPAATYEINRIKKIISYQDKTFNLGDQDLIRTESNLYLRSLYFGKVFGLDCIFNFRSLSVTVSSKLELPLIREMRQEEMRRNLTRLKGEVKADTTIGRTYPMFRFGMADWAILGTEELNGEKNARLNLSLGSMIAKGEATANLTYNSSDPFTERQQFYLWRYVNNDFKPLRQVMAGKITTGAISSIYNPVVGVQFTNTPTTYRRSFGSYRLSDKTEPGWTVELYVNNVLVDYVKADASGFFTFEVPLVYGNSIVKLKFFGPWGEERTREQNISIPFNFLPEKTFEYTLSAGIVEDSLLSKFSRASVNYGLSRSLTIGAGAEYLSSVTSGPAMPFMNASFRITNNLLLSGEYTYGVRTRGTLTYRIPSNLQLDLNYTLYDKNQKAINFNYREERKATLSIPLIIGKYSSYQRLTLYQIVLPASKYTTGEWLYSGSVLGVNTNLTTFALFVADNKPYLYSNLSLAFRLPAGIVFRPQAQYSYTLNKFLSARAALEKPFSGHAFLNMSYEQNFSNNISLAELGFRYDFSFAQTGISVREANKKLTFVQYARGSLINDRKTKFLGTDNRPNVGKGGISIVPFIDLNSNGKKDPGEPKAYGLNIRANGGRIEKSDRDTTIRILSLEPYTNCFVELDPNSFENISWRLSKLTYNIAVDPNILKLVEVPVIVAGEASGYVSMEKDGEKKGQGRVIVGIFTGSLKPAGKTLSEEDGYFSYFGLAPGRYFARIDTAQLRKLGMTSEPDSIPFDIKGGIEGDIADGLDFKLKPKPSLSADTTPAIAVKPVIRKDTTYTIIHEVTEELMTIGEDCYAIQVGAFKRRSNAESMRRKLQGIVGNKEVNIVIEGDFFRVRIFRYKTRDEVDKEITVLKKSGLNEFWIVKLLAKQQQRILVFREDTVAVVKETVVNDTVRLIRNPEEEKLVIVQQDTVKKAVEVIPEVPVVTEKPVAPEPTIALRVGVFHNRLKALRAQKKIMNKLSLPVEIVEQWGYYNVIVTGFFTREETYRYYPELAGIGYPSIVLIENYKRQK